MGYYCSFCGNDGAEIELYVRKATERDIGVFVSAAYPFLTTRHATLAIEGTRNHVFVTEKRRAFDDLDYLTLQLVPPFPIAKTQRGCFAPSCIFRFMRSLVEQSTQPYVDLVEQD